MTTIEKNLASSANVRKKHISIQLYPNLIDSKFRYSNQGTGLRLEYY